MNSPACSPAAQPADDSRQHVVLVTGPSGAGRSTAINALEDLGFEVIDNLPLSLLPRLIDGPPLDRPIALGIDVRNRDFGTEALIQTIDNLVAHPGIRETVLYIDCAEDRLVERYSETRRRHPLSPMEAPLIGIRREQELLVPIRARADILIDTSNTNPHDLRSEIDRWFAAPGGRSLSVTIQSFSYKRGLPRGMDIVHDVRFLRNPHWQAELRTLDGRDEGVAAHIEADPNYQPFLYRVLDLTRFLLPAYKAEGKTSVTIGFGCTGGKHRSVALAEEVATALAEDGWPVSKRHRELERMDAAQADNRGNRD